MKATLQEVFAVCFKYSQLDTFLLEMAFYFTNFWFDIYVTLHYVTVHQSAGKKKEKTLHVYNQQVACEWKQNTIGWARCPIAVTRQLPKAINKSCRCVSLLISTLDNSFSVSKFSSQFPPNARIVGHLMTINLEIILSPHTYPITLCILYLPHG